VRPVPVRDSLSRLARWPARRWATALVVGLLFTLAVAVPTDLVDTPWFGREIPPTAWAWPALLASASGVGLLVASYVRTGPAAPARAPGDAGTQRGGVVGSFLTVLAVGCPVCNKLVLLALGTTGALTWFEPLQPVLQLLALALLAWALLRRLEGEVVCASPGLP